MANVRSILARSYERIIWSCDQYRFSIRVIRRSLLFVSFVRRLCHGVCVTVYTTAQPIDLSQRQRVSTAQTNWTLFSSVACACEYGMYVLYNCIRSCCRHCGHRWNRICVVFTKIPIRFRLVHIHEWYQHILHVHTEFDRILASNSIAAGSRVRSFVYAVFIFQWDLIAFAYSANFCVRSRTLAGLQNQSGHFNFVYDFCFVERAILREIYASLSLQFSLAVCVRVCSVTVSVMTTSKTEWCHCCALLFACSKHISRALLVQPNNYGN